MSPIHDPRFSSTRWKERLAESRAASEQAARTEYLKPLAMLLLGGGTVMAWLFLTPAQGADAPAAATVALLYPVVLAIELLFGVAGLWVVSKLWLGGAGPLGLAILRLAGIYAVVDLLAVIIAPLFFVGWLIQLVCYVCLLAWLFELEVSESIVLALVTFVLKVGAGLILAATLAGAG